MLTGEILNSARQAKITGFSPAIQYRLVGCFCQNSNRPCPVLYLAVSSTRILTASTSEYWFNVAVCQNLNPSATEFLRLAPLQVRLV